MGVCESKDAAAASQKNAPTPSSSPTDKNANQRDVAGGALPPSLTAANNNNNQQQARMSQMISQVKTTSLMLPGRAAAAAAAKTTTTKNAAAHHLKNIFVAPLEQHNVKDYTPPTFPKTSEEQAFLRQAMGRNFVFDGLDEKKLAVMTDAYEKYTVDSNHTIIRQGDRGDYFYVLVGGRVEISVNDRPVGTLDEGGQSFGELALLYSAPRAATVTSVTECTFFRVDQTTFRTILQSQTLKTNQQKQDLLQKVPFVKDLDEADLTKLVNALTPHPFHKGDVLVKKGDEGDVFYLIQKGKVRVTDIEIGKTAYQDQILGPGDYFGERALMTKEPRAANCTAATDGIVLSIDSDTFLQVMGEMKRLVLKAADKRKLAAIKVFKDTKLSSSKLTTLAGLIVDRAFQEGEVIVKEGKETEARLFLVREGKVRVSSADGKVNEVIEKGGYLGEDLLLLDRKQGRSAGSTVVTSPPYTIRALELSSLGVLSLYECRKVFDTTTLGLDPTKSTKSTTASKIPFEELKKQKILGSGTFGQVWLVTHAGSTSGKMMPYALKIQSKYELVDSGQDTSVERERSIMGELNHPFIIHLVSTYQDTQKIYMLMELVQGGEFYSVIHKKRSDGIGEAKAKFYSSVILEGLGHMHRRHIVYRDLKPENILINTRGYPVIIDLGFAKHISGKTFTFCGTPLYIAPEVLLNKGHDFGADHWSFAALIYEMIDGETPFYVDGMEQVDLFRAIVKGKFKFPKSTPMSPEVRDLLTRMLVVDPTKRLGSLAGGVKDIYLHDWFKGANFNMLLAMEVKAPWLPKIKNILDSSAFGDWSDMEDKGLTKDPPISAKKQALFSNF